MEDILAKYPDKIPVIVHRKEKTNVPDLTRHKYLVGKDLTVGSFIYIIRKGLKLGSDKAIFVFVDNILPPNSTLMGQLYSEHAHDDLCLHVTYAGESTFG